MEAHLTIEEGPSPGTTVVIHDGQTCILGGGAGATFLLKDPGLAPRHTVVKLEERTLQALDLGGPGGTTINGEPLTPRQFSPVRPGDVLGLGSTRLRVDVFGGTLVEMRQMQSTMRLNDDVGLPLDEFEVEGMIGEGAFGRVSSAEWLPHQRRVAVKVLRENIKAKTSEHERFLREGRTGAQLGDTPYVVRVFDVRVERGRAFVVMELVEGQSGRDYLARGPAPLPEAMRIVEDVAHALAMAARVGVVHRDVKPANILLSPQGVAKLTDFGIAKDFQTALTSLTRTGQGLGTMAYSAPEQLFEAKRVDPSADVYALGVTLYHLIAGEAPFWPKTVTHLLEVLDAECPPLTGHRPDCFPELAELVHLCLSKEPSQRPDAATVARRLGELRAARHADYVFDALFGVK